MSRGGRPYIVAIAGGSASGKTSFALYLQAALGSAHATIVTEDSYYLPSWARPPGDMATYNFDRPETKDFDLLISHLRLAERGEAFACPRYDFATHERLDETHHIAPARVLIVEGLHNLGFDDIRSIADLTIFIEAHVDLRRSRRIARDVAERGRTHDDTARQFDAVVEPMHVAHVEPQKPLATRVIVNAGAMAALKDEALTLAREIEAALAPGGNSAH